MSDTYSLDRHPKGLLCLIFAIFKVDIIYTFIKVLDENGVLPLVEENEYGRQLAQGSQL